MTGIIIKSISDLYTIKCNNLYFECKARGKFRNDKITPLVGDYVLIDVDKKIITDILERKNELIRPPLSNIDQVLIITSVKEPAFDSHLLDKLLIVMHYNHIKPIICFTKLDLLNSQERKKINKIKKYYHQIGYKVLTNRQLFRLKKIFKNKLTVLTGQSGVGKSTLLNLLNKNLKLDTNQISKALGRGKHTTRCIELFELYHGLIADTPGFSALDLKDLTKEDIRNNMIEFNKYKRLCEYKDCFHIKEEACKIKDMVNKGQILLSRYENYKKFINDSRK